MASQKVEGTRIRGGRYFLNLHIPAELQPAFGGRDRLTASLKTADPTMAKEGVITAQAELIKRKRRVEIIATLPTDQRALIEEAGTVEALRKQFDRSEMARVFLVAGGAITASDLQIAVVKEDPRRVSIPRHERQHLMPQPSKIAERDMAEAAHKAELESFDRTVDLAAKALRAFGEDVKAPAKFGLRELIKALAPKTGVRASTVELHYRVADRFIDYHGDLPLSELTMTHLRDFADAYSELPENLRSNALRKMGFRDLIKITKAQGQPRISDTTRKQHIDTLKGLLGKAPSQGYLTVDPWASYGVILPKGKHSAAKVKARLPFTPEQAALALDHATTFDSTSIDHWGALLACYQGARVEEIAQLRGCNVFTVGGVWCIQITDEGEGQKVKTEASVRTVPLHQKVIDAGFIDFATQRPAGDYLFMNDGGEGLRAMKPNKHGRVGPNYSKRFNVRLRGELKTADTRRTFHSFRHLWEDAAENADITQTHRRDLAGRTKKDDSQAGYGEGPRMAAMKVSLDRIDPLQIFETDISA